MATDQASAGRARAASGLDGRGCARARAAARGAMLLLMLAVGGCAPGALLTYEPRQSPTVNLPLAFAGIRDARPAFAALFANELGERSDAETSTWLHGVESRQGSAAHVESPVVARFAERAGTTSVLIAGGLLGDCVSAQSVPFGDGVARTPERNIVEAYRQYDDLGLHTIRLVPLPGRASSASNGRLLADAIRAEAAQPGVERIVLVGYSKGVPDLLHALARLEQQGGVPGSLTAVVSVAGAVMGTPVADYYESMYDAISPLVTPFDCTSSQGGDLASVTRRERVAWLVENPPPSGPAYYSIVAHAPTEELSPGLEWTGKLLASVDPRNDGQLVAADAVLPGSTLLAEARSDHWNIALPLDRYPDALVRAAAFGRSYPRAALLRAALKWVVGNEP